MIKGFRRNCHSIFWANNNIRPYVCVSTDQVNTAIVDRTVSKLSHCAQQWQAAKQKCIHSAATSKSQPGIFTPSKKGVEVPFVLKPDLNLGALFGSECHELKRSLEARGKPIHLQEMIGMWEDQRTLEADRGKIESARQRNKTRAKELSKKKVPVDSEEVTVHRQEGKQLRENLKSVNAKISILQDQLYPAALSLPNLLHTDVPIGKENQVIEEFPLDRDGIEGQIDLKGENDSLLTNRDLVHPGACYLEGALAQMEPSLLDRAEELFIQEGFNEISCPDMIKPYMLDALGQDYKEKHEAYHIETKDTEICLTGLSPLSFYAYYMMSVVEARDLPERCFAIGNSYNAQYELPEFRGLHHHYQGSQVQFLSLSQNSQQEESAQFSSLMCLLEEFYRGVGIPFRIVHTASENLIPAVYRRQAIELWLPSVESYQEVAHLSSCSDYISRRLMIKYPRNPFQSAADSRDRKYAYSIHGTALKVNVLLDCLLQRGKPKR